EGVKHGAAFNHTWGQRWRSRSHRGRRGAAVDPIGVGIFVRPGDAAFTGCRHPRPAWLPGHGAGFGANAL
ncbi:MAG: hypothetical protein ACM3ST_16645, partial [Bdellovibrio bacteriovorus]